MATTTVIGIAGLGLVGSALALRLGRAGYAVLGFDVDPARAAVLEETHPGAARADLAALARDGDCLVIAVFDDEQVRALIASLLTTEVRRVAQVICITTALPATLREVGTRCADAGLAFVEAPISGSSATIAAGDGRMFVGGAPADIKQAATVLDAITVHRKRVGALGQASAAKLATNLVLGLNRLALAEGMVLAERLGLARAEFLDLVLGSAATSRAAKDKGQMMVADRFTPPVATIAQHAKDVGLMLTLGRETGQGLPLSQRHFELLAQAMERGDAGLDNAAVIRTLCALRAPPPGARP